MRLEDYFQTETFEFDGVGPVEQIRLRGSRIGIEHIIESYRQGESAERIWQAYRHSLSLEQVYATITWFLRNRVRAEDYLRRGEEVAEHFRQEQQRNDPPPAVKQARTAKAQVAKGQAATGTGPAADQG